MNTKHLIETAQRLTQPDSEAATEFSNHRDALAMKLNQQMEGRSDLPKLIGPDNLAMMQDNSRNFCRFMGTMFSAYEPEVLVHTALWVFRAYRSHGFQTTYWAANLDTFLEILRDDLTPECFRQVAPFFEWLITEIPSFTLISDQQMSQPLGPEPSHSTEDEPR